MGVLDRGDVHDGQRHPREQSSTGGTASEIEETLRFAALAGVRPMTETSPLDDAQGAYNRMLSGDARFRMVLTAASNQSPAVMLLPNIQYRHRNPARVSEAGSVNLTALSHFRRWLSVLIYHDQSRLT
jgi:hypothetical protein